MNKLIEKSPNILNFKNAQKIVNWNIVNKDKLDTPSEHVPWSFRKLFDNRKLKEAEESDEQSDEAPVVVVVSEVLPLFLNGAESYGKKCDETYASVNKKVEIILKNHQASKGLCLPSHFVVPKVILVHLSHLLQNPSFDFFPSRIPVNLL